MDGKGFDDTGLGERYSYASEPDETEAPLPLRRPGYEHVQTADDAAPPPPSDPRETNDISQYRAMADETGYDPGRYPAEPYVGSPRVARPYVSSIQPVAQPDDPPAPTGFSSGYDGYDSGYFGSTPDSDGAAGTGGNGYAGNGSSAGGQSDTGYSGTGYSGTGYSGTGYSGTGYSGTGYSGAGYGGNEYNGNGSRGSEYGRSGYAGNGYTPTVQRRRVQRRRVQRRRVQRRRIRRADLPRQGSARGAATAVPSGV